MTASAETYGNDGAVLLQALVPRAICNALINHVDGGLRRSGRTFADTRRPSSVVGSHAMELYGLAVPMLVSFMWGLTPIMIATTGCQLLPTYCFFRLYRKGERCLVHSDRPECEHSLSITLGLSDDLQWGLSVGVDDARSFGTFEESFGQERYRTFEMSVGDAVAYRGTDRRHARLSTNPNLWSAHLFAHWVDRDGPNAMLAFENNQHVALAPKPDLSD